MELKQAAHQILTIWHDLRNGKATPDECRERMGKIRDSLSEFDYMQAKIVAANNDR